MDFINYLRGGYGGGGFGGGGTMPSYAPVPINQPVMQSPDIQRILGQMASFIAAVKPPPKAFKQYGSNMLQVPIDWSGEVHFDPRTGRASFGTPSGTF